VGQPRASERPPSESIFHSALLPPGAVAAPSPPRFSLLPRGLAVSAAGLVVGVLWLNSGDVSRMLHHSWPEIIFWTVLILFANLSDVEIAPLQFTLDTPLLLATAFLYSPVVSAGIALVGSVDVREFRRSVSLSQAVYNRSQIALSVLCASSVFHASAGILGDAPKSVLGAVGAMVVFYVLNAFLVAAYVSANGQGSPTQVFRRLVIGKPLEYAVTYFGYGILALVLALLFREVGGWSVVLFLVPIFVAKLALVRTERLRLLAEQLRSRERLLERLSDQIVEERRDERLRIARGLHDDVLQSLTRISQLGFFLRRETESGSQAADDAGELVQISDDTLRILREVVGDLRKSPLGRGGLTPTLRDLARDLHIKWGVLISVEGPAHVPLANDGQLAVYQAAKEGILNALKHAAPKAIEVEIREDDQAVTLEVSDDGRGFEPDKVDESLHFGLGLIRERIDILGGAFKIRSRLGQGTLLIVVLPHSAWKDPIPRSPE
jgi:signal transduction histidine kinase